MTPKPQTPKPEALPAVYPDVEPGDHVYFRHPERGPMSAKVLATGKHGLTATCPMGDLYRVHWERVLGVKARMNRKFRLVENGADGCILEDDRGERRYVAHAEDEEDDEEPDPKPKPKASKKIKKAFPDHARALFLKTFIQGYVKRDGTAVQAHTDKRHPARQAAKAIRPLGGTVIGNAIPKDIVPVTGLNLLDKTVRTNEDLARICQVYRNPLYETFRVFYVRNGLIVGQCGLSARLPGTTPIPRGYENDINRQTERLKAEQVWLVHNHPSGDPTPSDSDRAYTFRAERDIRNFAGHVIINSGKYSAYSPKTGWATDAYLKKLSVLEDDHFESIVTYNLEYAGNFHRNHQWLMKSPEDNPKIVAEIAKRASMARGNIVLTSITRVPGRIRAIAELPANALQEPERTARRLNLLSATGDIILRQRDTVLAYLKLFAVQTGATQGMILFCPHEYRAEYEWLGEANVLLDVLSEDEDGNTRSLREDSSDLFDSRRGSWLGPESPKSELVEDFFTRMGYDAP